jgi:hypothetical protein
MKKTTLMLLLCIGFNSFSQLPESWFGDFVGELSSTNLSGKESSYHMELHIKRITDSTSQFLIVYGEDSTRQERNYQLNYRGKNSYEMDEKNSIMMHVSQNHDVLVTVFEVQKTLIHVTYRLSKKGITYELSSSISRKTTGGEVTDSNKKIPEVISYKTTAFQTAFLSRQ